MLAFEPCQDESIDWILHPSFVFDLRQGRTARFDISPMRGVLRALRNPVFDQGDLGGVERPASFDRRHAVIGISRGDALNDLAVVGSARNNRQIAGFGRLESFGAKVEARFPRPEDPAKIMHSEILIGDSVVFLNDEMPQSPTTAPSPTHKPTGVLQLYVKDCDAVFQSAVQAGARVGMPLADMFWGDRYGVVIDPFGQVWGIATHVKDLSPEEAKKAGQEWAAKNMPPGGQRSPQNQATY